jgi:outer membrane protein TolC
MTARAGRVSGALRQALTVGLCCVIWMSGARGQSPGIDPVKPDAPVWWRPYLAPQVPPIRLDNSTGLKDLIRAGALYLTVQDAIALVLENDIDIEVSRYGPLAAVWQLQRAEAGQTSPASLTPASLVGATAPGQGVSGSEAAAGVATSTPTQSSSAASRSSNATLSTIGPIAQSTDPVFQESTVLSHLSQPQSNDTLSQAPTLVSTTHVSTGVLQQGFLSGGSISVTYSGHYLSENSPTDIVNPSVAPNLSFSFQHSLLRGFGVAVNARYINAARINVRISDLIFKLQLINAVTQTLYSYYGLVADYEDVKAKQSALELAQALFEDNKKQLQVGSLTPLDVTFAEAQLAAAERDLLMSETALQQQEIQFKNLLSRTGSADPALRDVRILPIDHIVLPATDNLPSMQTMLQQALANRADLAVEKAEIEAAEVLAVGTKNGLLPDLQVSGGQAEGGLAGTRRSIIIHKLPETADAFFGGGTGTALGQVFRRDFPADKVGASLHVPIFNRQAQADYGVDQLSLRQSQLANQKDIGRVQVDLMNSVVMLQQARARYDAAVKNRILAQQLLDSEQQAYAVGKSTTYNVNEQRRDLTAAQDTEIAAIVSWNNARIALDETLGTILESNHVSVVEAKAGRVTRSAPPSNPNQ